MLAAQIARRRDASRALQVALLAGALTLLPREASTESARFIVPMGDPAVAWTTSPMESTCVPTAAPIALRGTPASNQSEILSVRATATRSTASPFDAEEPNREHSALARLHEAFPQWVRVSSRGTSFKRLAEELSAATGLQILLSSEVVDLPIHLFHPSGTAVEVLLALPAGFDVAASDGSIWIGRSLDRATPRYTRSIEAGSGVEARRIQSLWCDVLADPGEPASRLGARLVVDTSPRAFQTLTQAWDGVKAAGGGGRARHWACRGGRTLPDSPSTPPGELRVHAGGALDQDGRVWDHVASQLLDIEAREAALGDLAVRVGEVLNMRTSIEPAFAAIRFDARFQSITLSRLDEYLREEFGLLAAETTGVLDGPVAGRAWSMKGVDYEPPTPRSAAFLRFDNHQAARQFAEASCVRLSVGGGVLASGPAVVVYDASPVLSHLVQVGEFAGGVRIEN